jgi:hypothetical protein
MVWGVAGAPHWAANSENTTNPQNNAKMVFLESIRLLLKRVYMEIRYVE